MKRFGSIDAEDAWYDWQQSKSGASATRQQKIDRLTGNSQNRDVSAEDARKAMIERQRNNPTRRRKEG